MIDWYLQSTLPSREAWSSHGDGGDRGPSLETLSMWRYFFPGDPKVEALWRSYVQSAGKDALGGKPHLVEPLLWALADPSLGKPLPNDSADLAKLGLPPVMFDPLRSSLIARSNWRPEAAYLQFECRTDSVGASHEHADRGNFVFAALGRTWAKENFRSVETRHHNGVLIDGSGQGYWPGPGVWLGLEEEGTMLVAACDAKPAYDWMWPKQILTEDPQSFIRFQYPAGKAIARRPPRFRRRCGAWRVRRIPDPLSRPSGTIIKKTGPRLWDEDAWPVRFPHNPVLRAFRTVAFQRGDAPFLLIVDDIQKDKAEHLYEWLMQTGLDTEILSIKGNDIILCDGSVPRDSEGLPKPAKGDRLLLVRILDMKDPALARDYQSRPSVRLETFERKDTLQPESAGLSGSRSYGLDKRLVIASRSVAPDFKILLVPMRLGDPLPGTSWSDDGGVLSVEVGGINTKLELRKGADGRTLVNLKK